MDYDVLKFGINKEPKKLYFPPGPGAGVEVTAQALYDCLVKCVKQFRA